MTKVDGWIHVRISTVAFSCAALLLFSTGAVSQRNLSIAPGGPNEQRVALVIGNSAYGSAAALKNPVNDATDVAAALRELNFEVRLLSDADWRQMRLAIHDFSQSLRRGGIGLFYFAGHGIESSGKNYLIPIKSTIEDELDLEGKAIDANTVLLGMERAGNRVNIVILDACRNNPFARGWRSAPQGGLAQMNAPTGSFIAFATSPGKVASDGTGRNGIFTKHLLANLRSGESDIDRVFGRVTAGVAAETRTTQVPWKQSSLTDIFRFRFDEPLAATGQIDAAEQAQWNAVKTSIDPRDFDKFLSMHPSGYYASQARDYRTKLMLEQDRLKKFEAERIRLEEERRQQQARIEEDRRQQQARIEEERRRLKEQEIRLQESRARQEELEREKAETEKHRRRVYVPPTF